MIWGIWLLINRVGGWGGGGKVLTMYSERFLAQDQEYTIKILTTLIIIISCDIPFAHHISGQGFFQPGLFWSSTSLIRVFSVSICLQIAIHLFEIFQFFQSLFEGAEGLILGLSQGLSVREEKYQVIGLSNKVIWIGYVRVGRNVVVQLVQWDILW